MVQVLFLRFQPSVFYNECQNGQDYSQNAVKNARTVAPEQLNKNIGFPVLKKEIPVTDR
jgi:hypothetical protein